LLAKLFVCLAGVYAAAFVRWQQQLAPARTMRTIAAQHNPIEAIGEPIDRADYFEH